MNQMIEQGEHLADDLRILSADLKNSWNNELYAF